MIEKEAARRADEEEKERRADDEEENHRKLKPLVEQMLKLTHGRRDIDIMIAVACVLASSFDASDCTDPEQVEDAMNSLRLLVALEMHGLTEPPYKKISSAALLGHLRQGNQRCQARARHC